MSKVKIHWRCGHRIEVSRSEIPSVPQCQQCGERVVTSVTGATPKFTGACSGPLVSK